MLFEQIPAYLEFFGFPATTAGGAALGSRGSATEMNRPIGLAALTVLELPHEEQIRVAAQAGYTHVGPAPRPRRRAALPARFRRLLRVERALRRYAACGCSTSKCSASRRRRRSPTSKPCSRLRLDSRRPSSWCTAPIRTKLASPRRSASLCDLAARYGLAANLEPMPWVDVSNVATALRILDAAGAAERRSAGGCDPLLPRRRYTASACQRAAEAPALRAALRRQAGQARADGGDHPPGALRPPVPGRRRARSARIAARASGRHPAQPGGSGFAKAAAARAGAACARRDRKLYSPPAEGT